MHNFRAAEVGRESAFGGGLDRRRSRGRLQRMGAEPELPEVEEEQPLTMKVEPEEEDEDNEDFTAPSKRKSSAPAESTRSNTTNDGGFGNSGFGSGVNIKKEPRENTKEREGTPQAKKRGASEEKRSEGSVGTNGSNGNGGNNKKGPRRERRQKSLMRTSHGDGDDPLHRRSSKRAKCAPEMAG